MKKTSNKKQIRQLAKEIQKKKKMNRLENQLKSNLIKRKIKK
tara:strand:+ start:393 stop:518 length:126 start_codon:yes stop_codon:yes gene_type:complete